MNRGDIRKAIKNEVDDQTIDDTLANSWVQRADEKVQSWRPPEDKNQTFDYWDYLKTEQPYTTVANQPKYPVPENYRAFVELKIGDDHLKNSSRDYFIKVKEALVDLDVSFTVESKLVRGLDYYTHTVFEITDPSLGSQDALGAGGRYNDLVKQLGGPDCDAIGFALGIERILLALNNTEAAPERLKVFIIALDEKSSRISLQLLDALRHEGIPADMSYKTSSLKAQMKLIKLWPLSHHAQRLLFVLVHSSDW